MELELIFTELRPFLVFLVFLHCGLLNLCNHLLIQFSMDQFETMHTSCGHIEDEHVGF